MRRVLGAVIGAAMLAGFMTGVSATGASADTFERHDAAGDVLVVKNESTSHYDKARKFGDITYVKIDHAKAIRFLVRFRELHQADNTYVKAYLTSDTVKASVQFYLTGNDVILEKGNGTLIKCKDLAATRDYANNLVTMKVPRTCLENPTWIRAQIGFTESHRLASGAIVRTDDDGLHNKFVSPEARTPKLYRD